MGYEAQSHPWDEVRMSPVPRTGFQERRGGTRQNLLHGDEDVPHAQGGGGAHRGSLSLR